MAVPADPTDGSTVADPDELLELFDAAAGSRHLDLVARELRARDEGFYTIGSAGHEANAAVAAALRPTDPALLHYRSGGFYLRRAGQTGRDGVRDVLLGLVAAADEPMAGGRHKVFGHGDLAVIPQTSTIASHLPRAVGVAFAIERSRKLGVPSTWPSDAVTVCSFGDASVNHSTAAGAINTACHIAYQGLPLPLLLVCEDNGLGISVPTPQGWVRAAYEHRRGLRYLAADGTDVLEVLAVAREAVEYVRTRRRPAFLHLSMVRLMGHAGTDAETAYRTSAAVAADLDRDPLVRLAAELVRAGVLEPGGVLDRYAAIRASVDALAAEVVQLPKLADAAAVMAPIAPRSPDAVRARAAAESADPDVRLDTFGGRLPELEGPLTLAQSINRALVDVLAVHPQAIVFGQDVAGKGGVYGVTRGLQRRFGAGRVFDTLLDEQAILGLALGAGVSGLIPIAEIQYLAYLHNAEDQIRGEAATLQFFSQGRFRNPMVVRVAAYGYQHGFGGHFHNDSSVAVLRDVPGVIIASPWSPADAPAMLRTCVAAAELDGSVCVFLEPIARYHDRDVTPGDRAGCAQYDDPATWGEVHVPVGRAQTYGEGTDIVLVTFGNGVPISLSVAARLRAVDISARVLDLRWLAPLPIEDLLDAADATGRVLVVDETRRTGGVAEGVIAALVDAGFRGPMARVAAEDSFIPLGRAALHVLLSPDRVEAAAREVVRWRRNRGE